LGAVVGGLVLLNLATVMYSVLLIPAQTEPDPFGQFAWLRQQLGEAAALNKTVWIVGHIPPGLETYGYTELWQPMYVKSYLDIVQDPILGKAIAAQLFGHNHKDEFRLLPAAPDGAGPVLVSSSISPVYDNNPSFKLVEYCPSTGKLLGFKVFYTELPRGDKKPEWRFGYDLLESYNTLQGSVAAGGGGLRQLDVEAFARTLSLGLDDWATYAKWYATDIRNALMDYTAVPEDTEEEANYKLIRRRQYLCGIIISDQEAFESCAAGVFRQWIAEEQQQRQQLQQLQQSKHQLKHHLEQQLVQQNQQLLTADGSDLVGFVRWVRGSAREDEAFKISRLVHWAKLAAPSPVAEEALKAAASRDLPSLRRLAVASAGPLRSADASGRDLGRPAA